MQKAFEILSPTINEEYRILRKSFTHDTYYAVQILIRRLDIITAFFWESEHLNEDEVRATRHYFNFGWGPLLKLFLQDHDFSKPHKFIQTFEEDNNWADAAMIKSGRLAVCKQLFDYEKAQLLKFVSEDHEKFRIEYLHETIGDAYFEQQSANFYSEVVLERHIEEKKSKLAFTRDEIRGKIREILKNPHDKFISYETTPEIDDYYNALGHHQVLRVLAHDDFGSHDVFGSIEYWKYVDLIEMIVGVGIMHADACTELIKMNPKVEMQNILTYTYFKDVTVRTFASYLGVSDEEIEQIISCFTLSQENYQYYLDIPGVAPPIFFQVSENQLVRSIAGCFGNPFRLLNKELKRKYRPDYDRAVNNREKRFRDELFQLFPQPQIIKVPREINISQEGMKTDIDAVVYDLSSKTLGLFQLKWQDLFVHSMKERYSRMSNLFPKANEWIEKMVLWLNNNDDKGILNALQISKHVTDKLEINNICIFVIGRNQIHFTEVENDERIAWGSWYQIIESQAKIEARLNDPIMEMFVKLKSFTPSERLKMEDIPGRQEFDFKIGKYSVYYKE